MIRGRKPNLRRLHQMERLRAQGLTLTEIARQLSVPRATVYNALNRRCGVRPVAICRHCQTPILGTEKSPSRCVVFCRECLNKLPTLSFGQRLASLRIMAGLTQDALAQATCVSRGLISRLEHDGNKPRARTSEVLIEFLERALSKGKMLEDMDK